MLLFGGSRIKLLAVHQEPSYPAQNASVDPECQFLEVCIEMPEACPAAVSQSCAEKPVISADGDDWPTPAFVSKLREKESRSVRCSVGCGLVATMWTSERPKLAQFVLYPHLDKLAGTSTNTSRVSPRATTGAPVVLASTVTGSWAALACSPTLAATSGSKPQSAFGKPGRQSEHRTQRIQGGMQLGNA